MKVAAPDDGIDLHRQLDFVASADHLERAAVQSGHSPVRVIQRWRGAVQPEGNPHQPAGLEFGNHAGVEGWSRQQSQRRTHRTPRSKLNDGKQIGAQQRVAASQGEKRHSHACYFLDEMKSFGGGKLLAVARRARVGACRRRLPAAGVGHLPGHLQGPGT
jgi:hypothetical protein